MEPLTHKVPQDNYKEVKMAKTAGGLYIVVNENRNQPEWKRLTEPTTVTTTLSQLNKHHLQQMSYKDGIGTETQHTTLCKNTGFNTMFVKVKGVEGNKWRNSGQHRICWCGSNDSSKHIKKMKSTYP